ncbi:MAG TPA: OmpA family protein [Bryobacteraceae bacterium]|jgi:outer membrane protein OmpA-like peptidoglycan-associated protein|nr:OmpA family protein [Bryobacteraceae bacterium]
MTQMKLIGASLTACGIVCGLLSAQEPIYRLSVTPRTVKAINYQHRGGATRIDFRGTEILPNARGEAKVEGEKGYIRIEAEFDGLQPATNNGAEYLTYVLWAITPEGRTANLGEILLNGDKSKLNVTTELQTFGLVVTAEPYYAVTQPSDLIVMENVVRPDTRGKIEEIDAKYELLQRGQYQRLANPLALKFDRKQPLELYEARNAVQIARAVGADRFAAETFQKAEESLSRAEGYQERRAGNKPVIMTAREAVQTAEDARAIAVKRQEAEALAAGRQQSADREARAESGRAAAESETDRVTRDAEAARIKAQAESERLRSEKDEQAASSLAEADRVKRENDTRMAAAAADADRLKLENVASASAAASEVDRLKLENEAQRAASQADLDSAARQTAQLQADKVALRTQLLSQFNAILQTRDTARGLIVNMSDVLFDTAKSSLRPLAREKLAKVAGIVSGHPGLRLDVEGHTDSVGGDDYNQQLSEQRGESVRAYLTDQGMAAGSVTAKGFGKTQPVASNDTAEGRQQNRRVEIVISGEIIGTEIGTPIAAR